MRDKRQLKFSLGLASPADRGIIIHQKGGRAMAQMTWEEIAEQLIRDLQKGKYTSGEKLPSENKLAGELQVSRAEVRKAYSRLKELGYVYSLQGYGSFFAGKKEKIPLAMVGSTSFTQKMEELGIPHESRNIQAKRISYRQPIYESLGLSKDEPVWKVALLRIVDGAPAAVYTRYLPEKYFPRLPREAGGILSFHQHLLQNGCTQFHGENSQMTVGLLTRLEQEVLELPAASTGLVFSSKTVRDPDGAVLEVYRTVYRADRFIFVYS